MLRIAVRTGIAVCALAAAVPIVAAARGAARRAGPEVGDWACTAYAPGASLGSLGYTFVMRFTLLPNGRYRAGNASGRYAFDAGSGAVTWLDGELSTLYSETQLRPAKSGGNQIVTKIGKRRFTCRPDRSGGGKR